VLFALLNQPMHRQVSDAVEAGAIRFFAAAVGDANPAWWGSDPECPPALLSAWNRQPMWHPDSAGMTASTGLALHFWLKDILDLPSAVVASSETELGAALRPGMRVACTQSLISVGPTRTNRLGTGRDWSLRIDYRCNTTDAWLGAEMLRFFGYGGVM
jgi:hypothetical protein